MSSVHKDMRSRKTAENMMPILHITVYYMSSKNWVNIGVDEKNFPSMGRRKTQSFWKMKELLLNAKYLREVKKND